MLQIRGGSLIDSFAKEFVRKDLFNLKNVLKNLAAGSGLDIIGDKIKKKDSINNRFTNNPNKQ